MNLWFGMKEWTFTWAANPDLILTKVYKVTQKNQQLATVNQKGSNISQGSVATRLVRCDEVFSRAFFTNVPLKRRCEHFENLLVFAKTTRNSYWSLFLLTVVNGPAFLCTLYVSIGQMVGQEGQRGKSTSLLLGPAVF